MAYPCNRILPSNKKDWSTDICYSIAGPWEHYTKWKKLIIQGHTLYYSVHMKVGASIETESRLMVA